METKRIAFIGRFQPFHKGHAHVIRELQKRGEVQVVVGSAQESRTRSNPLTAQERVRLIKRCFPDVSVHILYDRPSDDAWTEQLFGLITPTLIVSGNDWVVRCVKNTCKTEEPPFYKKEAYNGTRIRTRIQEKRRWKHLVPGCSLSILQQMHFEKIVRSSLRAEQD